MKNDATDPDALTVISFQKNHDRRSFDMLYEKYKDGIFNYCCRFLGDDDEAADCTQEVFIRMFRFIDTFRFRSRFSTWLFRIAINQCNSTAVLRSRRQSGQPVELAERVREPSPDPATALSAKEAENAFQEALMKLKEVQRSMIILRDLEGKSYEEIAMIRDMNPGTVRSTLARARYKMAEYLNIYRNGM